jgi:hypothetical protein
MSSEQDLQSLVSSFLPLSDLDHQAPTFPFLHYEEWFVLDGYPAMRLITMTRYSRFYLTNRLESNNKQRMSINIVAQESL